VTAKSVARCRGVLAMLVEMPSNFILHGVGSPMRIAQIMISWGGIASATAVRCGGVPVSRGLADNRSAATIMDRAASSGAEFITTTKRIDSRVSIEMLATRCHRIRQREAIRGR